MRCQLVVTASLTAGASAIGPSRDGNMRLSKCQVRWKPADWPMTNRGRRLRWTPGASQGEKPQTTKGPLGINQGGLGVTGYRVSLGTKGQPTSTRRRRLRRRGIARARGKAPRPPRASFGSLGEGLTLQDRRAASRVLDGACHSLGAATHWAAPRLWPSSQALRLMIEASPRSKTAKAS